jgi:hypothetical protein
MHIIPIFLFHPGGVIIKEKLATQPSSTKDRNPFSNFRAPALEPLVHERFESLTKAPPSREALLAIPRASSRLPISSENTGALHESDSIVVPGPAHQKHLDSLSSMSLMCNATDPHRIPSTSSMYNVPVSMSLAENVFRRTRSSSPRASDAADAFSSRGLRTADGAGKGRPVTVTENLRLVRTRRSYGERLLLNSLRNEVCVCMCVCLCAQMCVCDQVYVRVSTVVTRTHALLRDLLSFVHV